MNSERKKKKGKRKKKKMVVADLKKKKRQGIFLFPFLSLVMRTNMTVEGCVVVQSLCDSYCAMPVHA